MLAAAHLSKPELKQELALALFQQERLTLAQASRIAEMTQLAFQALLAERQIPIHYGVNEFREDLRALRQENDLPPETAPLQREKKNRWPPMNADKRR
jgi:predicted HTH domain antitoxin